MKLSVIIPTCQRNQQLSLCLDQLTPGIQKIPQELYEVIVTDDGKLNDAKSLIQDKYSWVTWVEGPKRGPAANRNNGARNSKGRWLIFTDDDCIPANNWLQKFIEAIEEFPGVRAFEGAILPDDIESLKKDMAECPVNTAGNCFWSANIMVEKDIFWQIGGFDEQFTIAAQEDQDLQKRLIKFTSIFFIQNCIVVHPVRIPSLFKTIKKIPNKIFNWYRFNRKYQGLVGTVLMGLKSQALAFFSNISKAKIKSAVVNSITFLCLLPVIAFKSFIK